MTGSQDEGDAGATPSVLPLEGTVMAALANASRRNSSLWRLINS